MAAPTAYFEIKCIILPFVVAARRLFIAKMCHIFFFLFFFFFFFSKLLCKKGRQARSESGAPKSHAETCGRLRINASAVSDSRRLHPLAASCGFCRFKVQGARPLPSSL